MTTFRITVVNETFESCNHHEADTLSDAREQALKSALEIGVEEVRNGTSFFGAEVKLEEGDKLVGRFIVSMGASPLQSPKS